MLLAKSVVCFLFVSIFFYFFLRHVDTSDGDCTEYGEFLTMVVLISVILYRAHSAAQCKKAVSEDWQFCCYFMLKAGSTPICTYL